MGHPRIIQLCGVALAMACAVEPTTHPPAPKLGRTLAVARSNGVWAGQVDREGRLAGDWLEMRYGASVRTDSVGRFLLAWPLETIEVWSLEPTPSFRFELFDLAPIGLVTKRGFAFLGDAPSPRLDQFRIDGAAFDPSTVTSFGPDQLGSVGVRALLPLDDDERVLAFGYEAGESRDAARLPVRVLKDTGTDSGYVLETELTLGPYDVDAGLGNDLNASGGHRALYAALGSEIWIITRAESEFATSLLDFGHVPWAITVAPDGVLAAVTFYVEGSSTNSLAILNLDDMTVSLDSRVNELVGTEVQLSRTRTGYVLHARAVKSRACREEQDDCPDLIALEYDLSGQPVESPVPLWLPDPPGGGTRPQRAGSTLSIEPH